MGPRGPVWPFLCPSAAARPEGLVNMMVGMFGAFRNVTAHGAKIEWPIDEQDALDLLTLTSLLHRRLDAAVRTR